ncbi:MAG: hypothetical protein JWO59_764, partial [Chloroflexi bacterium]|nr:hypothetical protein [Chloroflexota bacterium]
MSYTGTQLSADAYRLCAELRNSIAHSESIKAESVKALLDITDRLNQRNGALEGPNGASITLRLSEYQANNLAQFLWAVVDHPKDEIGSWNT